MTNYINAMRYAQRLARVLPGRRVRVYQVKTKQCYCKPAEIFHPDYQGYEWYAHTIPQLQLPNLAPQD